MKKGIKTKASQWLPGLIISVLAFLFLSRFINISDFGKAIRSFSLINYLVFSLLIVASLVFRGFAWKFLVVNSTLKDAFLIINEGYFFNNIVPRSGEIARIFLAKTINNVNGFHATACVVFERAIDVVIAGTLFLTTFSRVVSFKWMQSIATLFLVIFAIVVFVLILASVFAETINKKLSDFNFRNPFLKSKIKPLIHKALLGLSDLNKKSRLIPAIFWIITAWVFWVGLLFYAIRVIDNDAPLWWALFAEGLLALGIALPSAPASLGVYEGTMVAALTVLGVKSSSALSLAIVLHGIQIVITSILGFFGVTTHGFKFLDLLNQIRKQLLNKSEESK